MEETLKKYIYKYIHMSFFPADERMKGVSMSKEGERQKKKSMPKGLSAKQRGQDYEEQKRSWKQALWC